MKSLRQKMILEIVEVYPVETQDELIIKLREKGCKATQATISRDIKELRLIKALDNDGKYRYVSPTENSGEFQSNFSVIFSSSVVSVDSAQNIVVIKTLSGMANAVCAALDSTDNGGIMGTIAGDDTIFILCRTTKNAEKLDKSLKQYITLEK